jgi:hypothetical protein
VLRFPCTYSAQIAVQESLHVQQSSIIKTSHCSEGIRGANGNLLESDSEHPLAGFLQLKQCQHVALSMLMTMLGGRFQHGRAHVLQETSAEDRAGQ